MRNQENTTASWITLSRGQVLTKTNHAIRWIVIYSADSIIHLLNNTGVTTFRLGQKNKLMTDWPVRQFSDALVEILAHEDTLSANFMRHVHFFKEFIGHHLQRILGPSLSCKKIFLRKKVIAVKQQYSGFECLDPQNLRNVNVNNTRSCISNDPVLSLSFAALKCVILFQAH